MVADNERKVLLSPIFEGDFPAPVFAAIRQLLLDRLGFDLGTYKDGCIRRRLARRARSCRVRDAEGYLERLRNDPDEVAALMAALTIHVSQFFRNPSTFDYLQKKVLPELLRRAEFEWKRPLRIWCAGCAGGEEPYSLALLLQEEQPKNAPLLLATDLSPVILAQAAEGWYEQQRLVDLPQRLRERFFTPAEGRFRLAESIRSMVRFQQHNIMTDREYPESDLILCRNVLIYFSRQEQERIVGHFARVLTPGGFLVLGRAENLMGETRERFVTENARERVYRCR